MLERIPDVPEGIVALRAVGTITAEDYAAVIEPLVEQARAGERRLRILLHLGPEYEGFSAGAVFDKTGLWLRNPTLTRWVEGYALVSDIRWVGEVAHLAGFLLSFPMRVFGDAAFDDAVAWLESLPEGPGVTPRLLLERGVLVVEVREPLRAQDFDAVAATADAWLGTHDDLPGIVVHAAAFPGWENLGSLLRHVRFVRDHHRRVRRVAIAADGPVADLAPRLAEHFVRAEVRGFRHDQLDDAVAWAAGGDTDTDTVGAPEHAAAVASGSGA